MRHGKLASLAAASCLDNCSARDCKYAAVDEGRFPFFFLGLTPPFFPLPDDEGGVGEDGAVSASDVLIADVLKLLFDATHCGSVLFVVLAGGAGTADVPVVRVATALTPRNNALWSPSPCLSQHRSILDQ